MVSYNIKWAILVHYFYIGLPCHGSTVDQVLQHTYYQGHVGMSTMNNFYRTVWIINRWLTTNTHRGENIAVARSKLRSPQALKYSSRLWPFICILLHTAYELLSKLSKDAEDGKSVRRTEKNAPQRLWFLYMAWNTGDHSGVGIHTCILFLMLVNSELVCSLSES